MFIASLRGAAPFDATNIAAGTYKVLQTLVENARRDGERTKRLLGSDKRNDLKSD